MPILNHPRPGVMNHQPPGPTCFMACVVAVKEFYLRAVLPPRGGKSPVQWMYDDFTKYHASATSRPREYIKLALAENYDGEQAVDNNTDEMTTFRNVLTLKISGGKPVLCGIRRDGAAYGHLFMIFGYTLPDRLEVADPAFGILSNVPVAQIKNGYNGNPAYHWTHLFFTKG